MLILKISWRNILRHKGKSFVIGIILLLGALIMTIGNAVIKGAQKGIEENFVNRFSGQIILVSDKEEKKNVLFTPMGKSLKVITNYEEIKNVLKKQDYITDFIPLTRGIAMIIGVEDMMNSGTFVIGTNFEEYQKMFLNNVELIEGEFLKNNDRGILVSGKARDLLYKSQDFWLVPDGYKLVEENLSDEAAKNKDSLKIKQELVFMGWGEDSYNTDIILPIKGIIRFSSLDAVLREVSFMDIESFRECFGYFTAADKTADLTEEELDELALDNDMDIFGGDDLFTETQITGDVDYNFATLKQETSREDVKINIDSGAYNFVSIKLKPDIKIDEGIKKIEEVFKQEGVKAKLIHWKDATGQVAQIALIFQGALSVFVFILFFIAIIIIMNTLSMAAIERTEEIGMMRAVGALKSFITKMFITETSLLSFFFGGIGIFLGVIISIGLSNLNIKTGDNEMLYLLFGGDSFNPMITPDVITGGIFQLFFVTIIAMIYPILVARKITPLDSINRN